jgi:hypothetical protein
MKRAFIGEKKQERRFPLMLGKILWASDDSRDSNEVLKYIESLNSKFNVDVIGLYVIPDYPDRKIEGLTTEQSEQFIRAIFAYLKTVKPIKNKVPDPIPLVEKKMATEH